MNATHPAERYQGADGQTYSVYRAGADDATPLYRGYQSRCGLCWLNISHSERAHQVDAAKAVIS